MPFSPSTYYARSADVDIAYQVFGDLPRHLVFVPGWVWNLELAWELPETVGAGGLEPPTSCL